MDNAKRKTLREAIRSLEEVRRAVEAVFDKESDCMDNYPENLQSTDAYDKMETAVDSLGDALERIDDACECIRAAI